MHKTSDDGACSIHAATGVRKLHSSRRDAFRPVNTTPLATVRIENKHVELELEYHYEDARMNTVSRAKTTTAGRYDENDGAEPGARRELLRGLRLRPGHDHLRQPGLLPGNNTPGPETTSGSQQSVGEVQDAQGPLRRLTDSRRLLRLLP